MTNPIPVSTEVYVLPLIGSHRISGVILEYYPTTDEYDVLIDNNRHFLRVSSDRILIKKLFL